MDPGLVIIIRVTLVRLVVSQFHGDGRRSCERRLCRHLGSHLARIVGAFHLQGTVFGRRLLGTLLSGRQLFGSVVLIVIVKLVVRAERLEVEGEASGPS